MKKKIASICAIALIALSSAFADRVEGGFFDDAIKQSNETQKPLLFLYTGSTWCGPCMAFEKSVLSTDQWKKYADEKITFLICDVKRGILNLTLNGKSIKGDGDGLKAQNEEVDMFTDEHNIEYVPTLMVYKPESKTWKHIKRADTPEAFIKLLDEEWAKK